jgi:hypothetical protein
VLEGAEHQELQGDLPGEAAILPEALEVVECPKGTGAELAPVASQRASGATCVSRQSRQKFC